MTKQKNLEAQKSGDYEWLNQNLQYWYTPSYCMYPASVLAPNYFGKVGKITRSVINLNGGAYCGVMVCEFSKKNYGGMAKEIVALISIHGGLSG